MKPTLALLSGKDAFDVDALARLFTALTGRSPTPEEIARARATIAAHKARAVHDRIPTRDEAIARVAEIEARVRGRDPETVALVIALAQVHTETSVGMPSLRRPRTTAQVIYAHMEGLTWRMVRDILRPGGFVKTRRRRRA